MVLNSWLSLYVPLLKRDGYKSKPNRKAKDTKTNKKSKQTKTKTTLNRYSNFQCIYQTVRSSETILWSMKN